MSAKWCHSNGQHGSHEWRNGLTREMHQCSGMPQEGDYEPAAAPHAHEFDDPDVCSVCAGVRCDACGGCGQVLSAPPWCLPTGQTCRPCRGEGVDAAEEDDSITQRNVS